MDQNDEQFESFLREFTPHHPRPLPATSPLWRRLGAAAAVTLVIGTSLWFVSKRRDSREAKTITNPQPELAQVGESTKPVSPAALTRLALEEPAQFDATLDEQSRRLLPRFDRANSTLRVLAKE